MYDTRTALELARTEDRSCKGNGAPLGNTKKWGRLQAQAKLLVKSGYLDFTLQGYHARRNRSTWTNGAATLVVYHNGEIIELPISEAVLLAA